MRRVSLRPVRTCSLAAALIAFLLLAAGCGSLGPTLGSPGDESMRSSTPAAPAPENRPAADEPTASTSEATAELKRVEREALATQRRMVRLEQEFIALLRAEDQARLRRKAVQVHDAYLALADATDRYRTVLRHTLGASADAALLTPYRKQAKGLRLAARGVDDYRTALTSGDKTLASHALREMERGEALMKEAGEELDAATGRDTLNARLY